MHLGKVPPFQFCQAVSLLRWVCFVSAKPCFSMDCSTALKGAESSGISSIAAS